MQVTISEAASLLGTSEAMLTRWARQGVIAAVETGGVFHFEKKDLIAWAARRRIPLREAETAEVSGSVQQISLLDAMQRGGFVYNVKGGAATDVLSAIVTQLSLEGVDNDMLLQRVLEREALSSTGIGNGIAIPHPRQPLETLTHSMVITCFPRSPIPYHAIDGNTVRVIFLVLSQNTQTHLKLLSQLSYMLHQPGITEFFCSCPSESDIMKTISQQAQTLGE